MTVIAMDNLRQLLVAIAALTLLFSVVSGANANYFGAVSAFADDEEDEGDDNSGSSESDREEHEDSESEDEHDESDEHGVEAAFGEGSKVKLGIDNEIEDGNTAGAVEADLEVEVEDGDVPDGEHDIALICETPDLEKSFENVLVVKDGEGKFEVELTLVNGTSYTDCQVSIGDLDVDLPDFRVLATAAEDEDEKDDDEREDHGANSGRGDDDDEEDDDERDDDESEKDGEHESKVKSEDNGIEVEVEKEVNMADGIYDVKFTCEDPDVNMTIEDSLKVRGGEAHFNADIELADGTYTDCKVMSGDVLIASFDSFTVAEDEDDDDVQEKRREKRHDIVARIDAEEEHKRRINSNPASTGDYAPGLRYLLNASGTATPNLEDDEDDIISSSVNSTSSSNATTIQVVGDQNVEVEIDMGVWKSNRALVLLSVVGGTVEVGTETYDVELGYALYSVSHNVMRIGAFVSDEDGNIYKLRIRGSAVDEDATFPMTSGESIEMLFGGSSGPARNSFAQWDLELEGTVEAK